MSVRKAVPIADVNFTPNTGFPDQWVNGLTGLYTNLFANIDETYFSATPGDYILMSQNADSGEHHYTAKLSAVANPHRTDGHGFIMYASYANDTGVGSTGLIVEIREGYVDEANPGTLLFQYAIGGLQFDGTTRKRFEVNFGSFHATNYHNLYVRFIGYVTPGGAKFDGLAVYMFNLVVPGAGTFGPNFFNKLPVSPIYGELKALNSVNGECLWQLLNSSANKAIIIYELKLWGGSGGTHTGLNRQARHGVRRTSYPYDVGLGGNIKYGNLWRLNPADTTPIESVLRGIDFANSQFHNIDGNFEYEFENLGDVPPDQTKSISDQWAGATDPANTNRPVWIRAPGSFPWTILPGSALEIAYLDNANGTLTAAVVFDEKELPIFD